MTTRSVESHESTIKYFRTLGWTINYDVYLRFGEDSVLTSLESLRANVLNLLGNSSSTTQSFVESVYFYDRTSSRNIRYAIPIASASLGLTDRQGYRIDKDFVNRFAVEGGYVDSRGNVLDLGRDVMGGVS